MTTTTTTTKRGCTGRWCRFQTPMVINTIPTARHDNTLWAVDQGGPPDPQYSLLTLPRVAHQQWIRRPCCWSPCFRTEMSSRSRAGSFLPLVSFHCVRRWCVGCWTREVIRGPIQLWTPWATIPPCQVGLPGKMCPPVQWCPGYALPSPQRWYSQLVPLILEPKHSIWDLQANGYGSMPPTAAHSQFGFSLFVFEAGFVFELHDVIGILSSLSIPLLTVVHARAVRCLKFK